jgi:hypothetical protein
MGRASRKKREQRDELPENLQFGPEFLQQSTTEWVDLVVQAGVAAATAEGRDG